MNNNFIPNFSIQYVQGYTAALQDVMNTFVMIQTDLKYHKRKQNFKTYYEIVRSMLYNRTMLREVPDAFIRCNNNGGFEIWCESWNKK